MIIKISLFFLLHVSEKSISYFLKHECIKITLKSQSFCILLSSLLLGKSDKNFSLLNKFPIDVHYVTLNSM